MEPVTVSVLHNVWAITYGGGQFVAVGDRGLVATSPDGLKWVGHFGRDQPDPKWPRRWIDTLQVNQPPPAMTWTAAGIRVPPARLVGGHARLVH
jgi:hypothetical protein